MELRFDTTLYSTGQIKFSCGLPLARGPQVPHPWSTTLIVEIKGLFEKILLYNEHFDVAFFVRLQFG